MIDSVNKTKSNKPIIGLLLSLSSIFFCCISFTISPQNFEELPFSEPLWLLSQFLLCLAGLIPLIGAILGILSLRKDETNRSISITAVVMGILSFIISLLMLGYTLFFSALALAWLDAMP